MSVGRYVLDCGIASKVWYVVSPENPLKNSAELAPFHHRVEMARLATADESRFYVSTLEQHLPTPSYTYNSVMELKKRMPDNRMAILCGSDIEHQLHKWYKIDQLRRLIDFVVYPRNVGSSKEATCSDELTKAPLIEAQATTIREDLMQNKTTHLDTLLCPRVKEYIIANKLYLF